MNYKKETANSSIQKHVVFAMGAGAIPVTFVDIAAVTGVQVNMLKQLCKIYEQNYSENIGKAFIASLSSTNLARLGASAIKTIPGIGTVLGGASMSIMSGASTYALGNVIVAFFENNISLSDINAEKAKKMYKEKVEEGKKYAADLKKKQEAEDITAEPVTDKTESASTPPKAEKKTDVYDELSKLGELRDKGIITEEEFSKMKKDIIDRF